jgi:hypothetical protein
VRDDFVLLAGSANTRLAQAIAAYLDHPLCQGETLRFSEGWSSAGLPPSTQR